MKSLLRIAAGLACLSLAMAAAGCGGKTRIDDRSDPRPPSSNWDAAVWDTSVWQ